MRKLIAWKIKSSATVKLIKEDLEFRSICIGLSIVILFFWVTTWWSPWPFIIVNLISIVAGRGMFTGWDVVIKRWLQPDCHPKFIFLTVLSLVIITIKFFAAIYMLGVLTDSNGIHVQSVWSHVYFSTVTLTTLGYGNIVPANTFSEVFAAIQSIIGFMGFAALTGIVVSVAYRRSGGG